MRTEDKENQKNRKDGINFEIENPSDVIFLLYIANFFLLAIFRCMRTYSILNFSDYRNDYFLGYGICIGFSFLLSWILNETYKKFVYFYIVTVFILGFLLKVPYVQYAHQIYLNQKIERYEDAVNYILRKENGQFMQKIELSNEYIELSMEFRHPYAYLITEEKATKVYFMKSCKDSTEGFLYVLSQEGNEKEMKKNYNLIYSTKGEQKGFWTWVSIEPEYLY